MREKIATEIFEEWAAIGSVLDALGSEVRQAMFIILGVENSINIKALAERLRISRSSVVHHLHTLQEAGVITSKKKGKEVLIKVEFETIINAVEKVQEYVENYGIRLKPAVD